MGDLKPPGHNPFDSPPKSSPKVFESPSKIEQFFNNELDISFARESLGILHHSMIETSKRDSLMLLSKSEDWGRESLGILNLDNIDVERPSLGMNTLKLMNRSNIISIDTDLNNAFIETGTIDSCSISYRSSWDFSKIYNISSNSRSNLDGKPSTLDKRFCDTGEFLKELLPPNNNTDKVELQRIRSFPEVIHEGNKGLEFWSSRKHVKNNEQFTMDQVKLNFDTSIGDDQVFDEASCVILNTTPPFLLNTSSEILPFDINELNISQIEDKKSPPQISINENLINSNSSEEHDNKLLQTSTCPIISNKNAQEILHNLSQVITNDPTINEQKKVEGQILINGLANLLNDPSTNDKLQNRDDSGHSSIESNQDINCSNHCNNDGASERCYEILDLRVKSRENSGDSLKNYCDIIGPLDLSMKSRGSENEFLVPRVIDKSDNNNKSSVSSLNSTKSRNLSIQLQNDSHHKLNLNYNSFKPKKSEDVVTNKGPMKAVIPIDNMTRRQSLYIQKTPKFSYGSLKKTSTPVHERNSQPVAQSTPEFQYLPFPNNIGISPVSSNKLSTQKPKKLNYSDTSPSAKNNLKTIPSTNTTSSNKQRYSSGEIPVRSSQISQPSMIKRRSLSDLKPSSKTTTNQNTVTTGKFQRSYSTGKEPKILASVEKAREVAKKSATNTQSRYSNPVKETKTTEIIRRSLGNSGNILYGNSNRKPTLAKKGKENTLH